MRPEVAAAKLSRIQLVITLGGKCALCSDTFDLEIDHIEGRTWELRAVGSHNRVRRYWKEHQNGVPLRVLCAKCNGTDGFKRSRRSAAIRAAEREATNCGGAGDGEAEPAKE